MGLHVHVKHILVCAMFIRSLLTNGYNYMKQQVLCVYLYVAVLQ